MIPDSRRMIPRLTRARVKENTGYFFQRWDVETDLRSLKQTLNLQMLRCQSVDMVAKQLVLAVVSHNLDRAVMNVAEAQDNLDPRRLSFSRSLDVVNAARPGRRARKKSTRPEYWDHSCKFPRRQGHRSPPRPYKVN
jgi:hypothetical protein